jgi:hypothetical protein
MSRFWIGAALAALACGAASAQTPAKPAERWIPLFNGKNLSGWTPKIKGYALGEDPLKTFRVENGVIKASYSEYGQFNERYGHLFYKTPFSAYVLRVEYRFVGDQCPGGAGWAFRNSGAMLHCQDPKTMRKDQDFPVSIEAQLLGGDSTGPRSTNNLCTPGTNVVYQGKLHTPHCTNSSSKTYDGDQWVTAEFELHGSGKVVHRVNGQVVLEYEQPQLDPNDGDAASLMAQGSPKLIEGGYISLQSESHPVEFRKVEIRLLSHGPATRK